MTPLRDSDQPSRYRAYRVNDGARNGVVSVAHHARLLERKRSVAGGEHHPAATDQGVGSEGTHKERHCIYISSKTPQDASLKIEACSGS